MRTKAQVSTRMRFAILRRDGFRCVYCGRSAPDVELAVDHATSRYDGGSNDPGNLVTACVPCNHGKGAISVEARVPEMPPPPSPLIGKWFHVNRKLETKRGQVLDADDTGVMVRWFGWESIEPRGDASVFPVADFKRLACCLHDDSAEWERCGHLLYLNAACRREQLARRLHAR